MKIEQLTVKRKNRQDGGFFGQSYTTVTVLILTTVCGRVFEVEAKEITPDESIPKL